MTFYGYRTDYGIELVGGDEGDRLLESGNDVHFWAYPGVRNADNGVVGGFVKVLRVRSIDVSNLTTHVREGHKELSDAEVQEVASQIVEIAKLDPWLAQYNPGGPPVTTINMEAVVEYAALGVLFTGLPIYLFICIYFAVEKQQEELRAAGKCVHCHYDCNGLYSPICPECGREHGSGIEVVA